MSAPVVEGLARVGLAFVTGLAGLLLVSALFAGSSWSWLLWIAAGLVAGVIAGRVRYAWVAVLVVVAFYPLSVALGLTKALNRFWVLEAVIGVGLVVAGFLTGTAIGWRRDPRASARAAWHGTPRVARALLALGVAAVLVGLGGYMAYVGSVGSEELVHPTGKNEDCRTPAQRYGWDYEAVNYDPADDLRLAAANPDMRHCTSQGEVAGDEVVTSDGVHIGGWYLPATSGVGSTAPTVILVHGWKANKSEVLKYAPAFHATFNLVAFDLRNGGRSSPTETTMGLREKLDLEAVIDWLVRTKHPRWIGVMGNSMGGAAALAAADDDPRIEALVLDSLHARAATSIGNILELDHGHPPQPGGWAIVTGASLRLWADVTDIDPVRTITRLGDRPVLLIHGTWDEVDRPAESAELNFHAALDAGVPVELQYCQGGTHGEVIDHCPVDWARWAVSFLTAAVAR